MTNTEIISTIVTILIGIVPLILTYRKRKFAISSSLLESYSFHKKLDKINVTYTLKGRQCENAYVLKLVLKNYGKYDIDSNVIKKPISMILPKELQWLDFAISDSENIPKATLNQINDSELLLNWELLKSGETINIETLIINKLDSNETMTSLNVFENLTFNFRISNISTIKKNYLKKTRTAIGLLRFYLALFGVMLLINSIPGLFPSFNSARYLMNYNINFKGDTITTYSAYPKNLEEIVLYDISKYTTVRKRIKEFTNPSTFQIVKINEFNKHEKNITLSIKENNKMVTVIYIILGLTFLLIFAYPFLKKWKMKYK